VSAAQILQISVSKAKDIPIGGGIVSTGIFKEAVTGKLPVGRLNIEGDEQADLTVHGGPDKAVYAYPISQYEYWKTELPNRSLSWGAFGENLTVSGFDEHSLCIGDRLSAGSAVFCVTQPRIPCYKLGIRFGDGSIVRRFYKSGKWGFYLSVIEEGEIEVGDNIKHEGGDGNNVRLFDVSRCLLDPSISRDEILRVLASNLAEQMKDHIRHFFG
jgi:MOSC domain-containing protein YiiM